jgi:ABC-type polysaccharide/polyol phosphate export permease
VYFTAIGTADAIAVITAHLATLMVAFASAAALLAVIAHYFRDEISLP